MSDPVLPFSRLRAEPRPGLSITAPAGVGQITLRSLEPGGPAVAGAVRAAVGTAVPGRLEAAFGEEMRAAVWMAPDELLLLLPRGEVGAALSEIAGRLAGEHHLALDVSDARGLLRLEGPDAAETLAKGVPVDVSDRAFPVGRARRTHLGGIAVGLWRRGPESWEIVAFRSYAHHLLAWLERSGQAGAKVGRFTP